MYIDIGLNLFVRDESVVGVFDLDNTSYSKWTRKFLSEAEQSGEVVSATDELPKSFVFCAGKNGKGIIYLSQLNSATLVNRVNSEFGIRNSE